MVSPFGYFIPFLSIDKNTKPYFFPCVPSQYGAVLVRPQLQSHTFFFSATANWTGVLPDAL
jgi:hypothetical protein